MASGIFAIFDDIAALMDDVAVTSKIAGQKTAAILGDDLAVNAEKATGFLSSRELPVLWAITKGSFLNKLIIVPIAILLNVFFPVVIKYILLAGGCYLAFEGVEKVIEYLFHRAKTGHEVIEEREEDAAVVEKKKIRSAVTTDFILSIEIVIIALGTTLNQPLTIQILTVAIIALVATIGVYGIVALIVRMDDTGYKLIRTSNNKGFTAKFGHLLVRALPIVIKGLGVVGTVALLMVSGGIFVHNIDFFHHLAEKVPSLVLELGLGLGIGLVLVALYTGVKSIFKKG
ncbi:DUF808 domain-containing protein [Sphingobacterium sp. MYb382]|uniref:DUF808 domain-containing protein n=1 Tax=Sphingobacterium sp. MYb382 TaxID=2745278 RepID=UPI003096E3EE